MSAVRQGNLRELASSPDAVLPSIVERRLSGHLMLMAEDEGEQGQELLYIQDGVLLGCSSMMNVPVRSLLISNGIVSPEAVAEAEKAVAESPSAGLQPEHILIQRQLVTPQEIFAAVANAVKDRCVEGMAKPFGLFVFRETPDPQPPRTLAKIPMSEVALHYARAVPDASTLAGQFLRDDQVLALSERLEELRAALRYTPQEWKVLFRVDSRRTVADIFRSLSITREEFDRLVLTALLTGAVRISAAPLTGGSSSRSGSLSAAHVAGDPAALPTGATPPPKAAADPPTGPDTGEVEKSTRKRVLIVDDSRTIQRMVQMALQELGLDMETADDGYEAIQLAEANHPDIVVLDVIMPRLDGYKTCARLRKILPESTPILMLTAKDGTFNFLRGKMAGATAYLTKPFEPDELRKTVKDYLDGKVSG
jgi:twitching motility two-component system response regulator PilG